MCFSQNRRKILLNDANLAQNILYHILPNICQNHHVLLILPVFFYQIGTSLYSGNENYPHRLHTNLEG